MLLFVSYYYSNARSFNSKTAKLVAHSFKRVSKGDMSSLIEAHTPARVPIHVLLVDKNGQDCEVRYASAKHTSTCGIHLPKVKDATEAQIASRLGTLCQQTFRNRDYKSGDVEQTLKWDLVRAHENPLVLICAKIKLSKHTPLPTDGYGVMTKDDLKRLKQMVKVERSKDKKRKQPEQPEIVKDCERCVCMCVCMSAPVLC